MIFFMPDTVQEHSLGMGKSSTDFSAIQPTEHCLNDTAGPAADYPSGDTCAMSDLWAVREETGIYWLISTKVLIWAVSQVLHFIELCFIEHPNQHTS